MRKIIFFILIAPLSLFGQDFITITESEYAGFTETAVPAYKAEIIRVGKKEYMDSWAKFLTSRSDAKIVRTDDNITIEKAVLKNIRTSPMNIYMHFEDMENGTRVFFAFEDTVSGFIRPDDSKYGVALKGLILDRSREVFMEAKKGDLAAEEKHLKKLEGELDDVKGDEDKITKKIMQNNRDIEKLKSDIEINNDVLLEVRDEVANERSRINSMNTNTPDEVRKGAEKELKKQEKKRDNLSKEIDKSTSKILDIQNEIRDLEYELEKLKQDEKFASDRVMQQREIVMQLKNQVYELNR